MDQLKENFKDFYNYIKPLMGGGYLGRGFTPVGTIIAYYGKIAPANYLICDGSEYNKSDYPELWTHLSTLDDITPYTVDGNNKKFRVPDLRGEFLRGAGTNSHSNQGSGGEVGDHQDGTLLPRLASTTTGQLYIANYRTDSDTFIDHTDKDVLIGTASGKWGNTTLRSSSDGATGGTHSLIRPTNTSVLFCIAVKNFTIGDVSNNYSTEEQVIGTWIDGKPLYQKTIDCGVLPDNTDKTVTHDISNIDIVCSIDGCAMNSEKNFIPIPSTDPASLNWFVGMWGNATTITIRSRANYSSYNMYATLQYTKTID